MDILKKIITPVIPLLLAGCNETFDPLIDTEPVLCLNSLITAGEPIEVSVTRTWLFTDEEGEKDHSVKDAEVRIYANGVLTDSEYLPLEGDTVRIEAYSNTYGFAEAEVVVPVATPMEYIDFTPEITGSWFYDREEWGLSVDLRFNLPITITLPNDNTCKRYYKLIFNTFSPLLGLYGDPDDDEENEESYFQTSTVSLRYFVGSFYVKDSFFTEFISAFEEIMGEVYINENLFFSNRQFKGDTQDLHLGFDNCSLEINQWDRNPELLNCGVTFTLYSISESYYNWMNYCWQTDESILGEISDFGLAEPMWGYSNVSTGAGVVAAQSSSTITLNLHDFFINSLTPYLSY